MSGVFHPMPAVQNVEMQEAQQPWPILRPKAKDIGPRAHALIHEGRLDCQPPLKIRFEEPPETVCLLDGDEVQLSRRSYTDLQIAQVELEKHMQQLKRRISRFPQGDVRDFVNEALHTYEKAQSERKRLFSSVSTLLRNAESAYQAKSRKELDDQVFQLGASLRSASRSLKVAQEEMGYAELPADANLEATRDCLTRYDNILEELLLKQDAPKETSESKDNESLV